MHGKPDSILRQSELFSGVEELKELLNGPCFQLSDGNAIPQYVLGGSCLPLLPWLLMPFGGSGESRTNVSWSEAAYNSVHGHGMELAGKAFGRVLEYSASLKSPSGEIFMTPADLMRAVVLVFPPSEANRESSFSVAFKMFDLDNNGEIDQNEFKKVMALMRAQNRQGARHRDGLHVGLEVSGSVENGDLLEYFFGKDAKACLEHGKFVQFLRDLHNERELKQAQGFQVGASEIRKALMWEREFDVILRLEFAHYDYNSVGTISAKDFALSMVASADMKNINKFLDRFDEITNEPGQRHTHYI
ncbi:hypothetical protein RJ639_016675 [Escallonia herrerae]|uniref:EF-hand domain-containing protein n=1 Tax=Escallonia herrerae TaxID=1293975 RepID=A0AA88VCD9_9ASTE|nr:hypothetical protein RJ639_016675 [Escallonia herrerae]